MKSVKENKLIILILCLFVLLGAKKATGYLEKNIARVPVAGSNFGVAQTSPPQNLGNLYPVFAESLKARQYTAALDDIDRFFVPPPQEAPVKPEPKPAPVVKDESTPVLASPPPPKPEPVNHLKRIARQFSLDGLSGRGAYINGKYYSKGDIIYRKKISGKNMIIRLAKIQRDSVVLQDNQKHWQKLKFKG